MIWLDRQLTHDIACTRFHFRRCREKFHLAYRSPQIPSNSPNLQSTNATLRVHLIAPEDARATTIARCSSPSGGPDRAWREAAAHHRVGRRAKKDGACVGRPRLEGLEVMRYAALALLVAVGRAGFGWAFAVVFLTACAFSFAANSALTFWVMASVSTL